MPLFENAFIISREMMFWVTKTGVLGPFQEHYVVILFQVSVSHL